MKDGKCTEVRKNVKTTIIIVLFMCADIMIGIYAVSVKIKRQVPIRRKNTVIITNNSDRILFN